MNYYERHLGDYAKDTAHLTMLEHGAYGLLLDRYYSTEAGIPEDQAHRVARARSKEEKQAVDAVLSEFFTLTDGVWMKGRVEEEIEKANARIDAAQKNGKKGGRPKKAKPSAEGTQQKPTGLFLGSENETQMKALQSPHTTYQQNPLTPKGEVQGFETFWDTWPKNDRKQAKGKCEEAWRKQKLESIAETVVSHVQALSKTDGWTKQGGSFVPAPLVYLNQRRWEGAELESSTASAFAGAL